MRRITVLPLFPATDATGFYRGMGALANLKHMMPELEIMFSSEQSLGWVPIALADVLYMQRPFTGRDVLTMQAARRAGLPVWIDYDDDLLNIPDDNPTAAMYQRPELQRAFLQCLQTADHVSFSTAELAKRYGGQTREHSVIPNAFPDHVVRDRKPGDVIKQKTEGVSEILWRGTPTHRKDVWSVSKVLIDGLIANAEKYRFSMIGDRHWQVGDGLAAKSHLVNYMNPISDILDYYETLREVAPRVMLSPLVDNPLNRSKSNIMWIEATYAGAMVVAPDWMEWQRPGVVNYDGTPAGFAAALDSVLQMPAWQVEQHNLAAWKLVPKNRLSVVNEQRRRLLEQLAAKR